ncbi:MAG: hypothetical protein J3Q66DRAFT_289058, partial [Benniella sp.]
EPPTKIRKKPGRKPNPASPALRKEQNRAAQRAFRDRKERHLQDLEGSIKELKETNTKITQQSQQDAQQFKAAMENLQSENYYLRQVVLSFESALSKSGNAAILYEVKAELYHRHYEKYTKGISEPTPLNRDTDQPVPSLFIPNATIPPQLPTEGACHRTPERPPAETATSTTTSTSTCTKTAIPSTPKATPSPASSSPPLDTASSGSRSASSPQTLTLSPWEQLADKPEVIPSHRLQLEIKVLASAPPAVDPNIDAKIYALPHDPRIDLIPCPRLRAMMILHQRRFNVDELCQLLLDGAKCHGHPLDPHSWELPDSFFDRFGFLLGEDMLRHRSKIWPRKDDPSPGKE